jgi:16S rRNA (uracil1498-N3)-methyltransferase
MKRGDHVILSDGGKREYEVQFTAVSPHAITGVIIGEQDGPPEPAVTLVLYQSLISANRFDLVLEKGSEIGVSRFVPIASARSQIKFDEQLPLARAARWERIVVEAAEQCGRGRVPVVDPPLPFGEAIRSAGGLKLLSWEGEKKQGLGSYLRSLPSGPGAVSLFIGPEGGFDDGEVELARAEGAVLLSLGSRLLRSETAGIVAAALVLEALGEMGR